MSPSAARNLSPVIVAGGGQNWRDKMRTYKSSRPPENLQYDEQSVVKMLRALLDCPLEQRMDSLAVVVKVIVEGHMAYR
jgi:hypothetical protein